MAVGMVVGVAVGVEFGVAVGMVVGVAVGVEVGVAVEMVVGVAVVVRFSFLLVFLHDGRIRSNSRWTLSFGFCSSMLTASVIASR